MLNKFQVNKYKFEFNGESFYTFDKKFIPYLLGKTGNQTAINTAGSAWKKVIRRYPNKNQVKKTSTNPKWLELFQVLNSHLTPKSKLFVPNSSYLISDLELLLTSTQIHNKQKLGEFFRFREIQRHNLIYFKKDLSFRQQVLSKIFKKNNEFRRDIPLQYSYILLTLHIAKYYSIFHNYKYKNFSNKIGISKDEYQEKFVEELSLPSPIENITAFCYTQYFWFDYRLSTSQHSEIHKILFNMFNQLKL